MVWVWVWVWEWRSRRTALGVETRVVWRKVLVLFRGFLGSPGSAFL